jgi:hypothetical protein
MCQRPDIRTPGEINVSYDVIPNFEYSVERRDELK